MLNRYFKLEENGTTVRTEILAGITTFLTMAYIIFVQPAVLSGAMFGMDTGLDFGAVTVATCLSAALATALMGLLARYPIAQAPGMGENFFFVFTVIGAAGAAGLPDPWRVALGVVFISGVLFLLLSALGLRKAILDAVSPDLRHGIAAGIGLFIAFIGLQNAGVIQDNAGTLVSLNTQFLSPDRIVFFFGLLVTAALYARKTKGAILWGILSSAILAVVLHTALAGSTADRVTSSMLMTRFEPTFHLVSLPPSIEPTFFRMDLAHALSGVMIPFIVIFLFMDMFDTLGTLVGVSEQAGFIKDNQLPRAGRAMLSDAVGTVAGACLGTSTVTSFIESASGVEAGGRTGLTALVVAAGFLLALFFSPLIATIGSYAPITAPALVVVGSMMLRNAARIDWRDATESIPAFLIMLGIPLSYSIADGLALGFIAYPLIKLLSGRGRELKPVMIGLAVVLLFVFIRFRS